MPEDVWALVKIEGDTTDGDTGKEVTADEAEREETDAGETTAGVATEADGEMTAALIGAMDAADAVDCAGIEVVEGSSSLLVGAAWSAAALPRGSDELRAMPPAAAALATVPFQITRHELVSPFAGTDVHHCRSCPPKTAKPFEVSFPCAIMSLKKLAALALMVKAWTWKMIWIKQWRTENMK